MSLLRPAYRLLLRLHPAPFRDRFAAEMLWIFDAECHRPALLLDGLVSLLRQHAKARPAQQPVLAGFGLIDHSAGVTPRRLVEATMTATLLLCAVFLLLNHPPRSIGLPICQPGAPYRNTRPIQAPPRIQPLAAVVRSKLESPTGPVQVDNGVAGALRVLRASTNSNPGYCSPTQTN